MEAGEVLIEKPETSEEEENEGAAASSSGQADGEGAEKAPEG